MLMYIQIQNVSKFYRKGANRVKALEKVNLDIGLNEFVALKGPSGSGKTTLMNLIGGLDTPDAGRVLIGGKEIVHGSDRQRANWRAENVGFIFQFNNLLSFLTAEQNVEIPLLLRRMSSAERKNKVKAVLKLVGLGDRLNHKPNELSGGQEQRVAIARAIVADPCILLCDEPTGDLDKESADEVLALLRTLKESFNKTILMVTHDQHASQVADRSIILNKGKLVIDQLHSCGKLT
ncbi:MAG: ABC transporter ATP-binding protein [Gammaproteobacteria bacterium]|nr:ABC transporter ATP-binding protein [Gammaproteobacteria bacterium]MYH45678.1 ABC transporter ATP-binding protein [Gammaproteobacteria bacterium]MYL12628.1 ABC transporter ATP-binding protein [Gammaproteobacteria bacterium]